MFNSLLCLYGIQPNTYVSGQWVDVDSAWEQKKLEARECLKIAQNPALRLHALLGGG